VTVTSGDPEAEIERTVKGGSGNGGGENGPQIRGYTLA
jgi:hypothetical protein